MSKYDKNITEVIIIFNVSNRLYRYNIIIIFLCVFYNTFLCVYTDEINKYTKESGLGKQKKKTKKNCLYNE